MDEDPIFTFFELLALLFFEILHSIFRKMLSIFLVSQTKCNKEKGCFMKILLFSFMFSLIWSNTTTFAGSVIAPVEATSTIRGDAESSVRYLISDNPSFNDEPSLQHSNGRSVTLPTGSDLKDALTTFHARSGLAQEESWTQTIEFGHPLFVFDLTGSGNIEIDSIILWQYGNNGGKRMAENDTKNFRLLFHTEEEGTHFDFSSESIGFFGQMKKAGFSTNQNPAQRFVFPTVKKVRYVAMTIDSNFGYRGMVGKRYGLGEVRFSSPTKKNSSSKARPPSSSNIISTTISKHQPTTKTPPLTKKEVPSPLTKRGLLSLFAPLLLLFRKKG